MESALRYGAGAITNALGAFQKGPDSGVGLGALEFLERIEMRVAVIQVNHKADGTEILAPVIHEKPAARVIA